MSGNRKNAKKKSKAVPLTAGGILALILAVGAAFGLWRPKDAETALSQLPAASEQSAFDETDEPLETQAPETDGGTEAPEETSRIGEALKYVFYNEKTMRDHFKKHKEDTGCATVEEYLARANAVIENPKSLHKLEAEDGDDIYYLEATNEIVFVAPRGYIRTYFRPDSGKAYFDKQ